MQDKIILGREEWAALPELGIAAIKMRVDSGAKTSSLHAFNIRYAERDGRDYAIFNLHPIQKNRKISISCEAPLVDHREVRSSSGHSEQRPVIMTRMKLGEHQWDIEVTLTNRDAMGYRMLLGRQAMEGRVLIDPEAALCQGNVSDQELRQYYDVKKTTVHKLNIIVLASNPDLYSNRRLIEAGEQRGHKMRFVNLRHCYMNISASNPEVHYRGGEVLENIDAVIPRIRPSQTFYGCAVTRQFHTTGAFCLNDSIAIQRSRDKLRTLQMLAKKGVNMPVTGFAQSPLDTKDLIEMVGGAPLVVKLLEGAQGRGVVLAETQKAAESVINAFKSLQADILVQEFIKEAKGMDIRCFVIGNKVVGAIQRQAMEGEFRANLHLGGSASSIKITAEERRMALQATKLLGLHVAGVDIIRSSNGPKILEINSSPGLEGIEAITGIDIAGAMIEAVEKGVK